MLNCHKYKCAVLLKGGHSVNDANDLIGEFVKERLEDGNEEDIAF